MTSQRLFIVAVSCAVLALGINSIAFARTFPDRVVKTPSSSTVSHLPVAHAAPTRPAALPTDREFTAGGVYVSFETPQQYPLVTRRADVTVPLASITKLMTALVLLDAELKWDEKVTILASDRRVGGRASLFPGEVVRVGDLWELMLVASDNDAAAALVRHVFQDEALFVAAMNEQAAELGLVDTRFVDPTGLEAGNVGTPREVAALARVALMDSAIRDVLPKRSVSFVVGPRDQKRDVPASDLLLRDRDNAGQDGWRFVSGKTGYIDESAYNVVLVAEDQEERRALVVLLGVESAEERAAEVDELLAWTFTQSPAVSVIPLVSNPSQ